MISLPLYPQSPIVADRHFRQVVLSEQTTLLADTVPVPHSREVIKHPAAFRPQVGPSINPGFTNQFYWVHFRVRNPEPTPKELVLEVENPHINKLQLFTHAQGRLQAGLLTGDHFPFSRRPIRHPHFLFPITIAGNQTIDGYLWVDKHGEQVQIPLRLWAKDYFMANTNKLYLFVGFMFGIGGLYCVLSLLALLFFRLRLMFYYFGYTVSAWLFLAAHTGFGFALLWPQATWWTSAARPTLVLMMYISSVLFVRVFFRLETNFRRLFRYTTILLSVQVALLLMLWLQNPALGLFKNYWYNPVYYSGEWLLRYMIVLHGVAIVSIASVIFVGLRVYWQTRRPEGLWVAIGYLMALLSGSSITLVHVGLLPDNYVTHNLPLVTNALDTIILSVLLANRFKDIHVQNARIAVELALQRQKNAIQLLEGQIIERKRLSQELHDGISLSLANIRMKLSMLADSMNGRQKEAQQLVQALGNVGQDVRQFSHALSPVMLERYGLVDALDELTQQIQDSHPDLLVVFQHEQIVNQAIHPMVSQTMYQISLELLNNVLKHAEAQSVTVQLNQADSALRLLVSDDGRGYDLTEKNWGIGLQNIQARVQLLGGQFVVQRQPQGMVHRIELPAQTKLFS
ncbi:hypothetical protein GCM10023187_15800 [Nibrella viscosa]|uniref:histidine kinase n=2 Tax=Nibrella viscosa TaxID=1084524 RepID=A0ABP8K6R6_9BACT